MKNKKDKKPSKPKRTSGEIADRDLERTSGGEVTSPRDVSTGQASGKRQY